MNTKIVSLHFLFNKLIYLKKNCPNSCILKKNVKNSINFCEKDYSFFSEESRDFGFGWSKNFSNFTPTSETNRVFDAFRYKNSEILETYPYFGVYNTYSGGGYVYELRGSLQQMNDNLSLLQNMSWIDRKTRAVFAEFTLFNPNVQLLCVKFLPTGNLVKSARMEPVNLFNDFEKLFSYRTLK
ncbi:polycystic kidney disease 1-like 2 [Brachionus plicatilis]|uniref:Polycystic kidney disease 1-like 2 n=1 Tax=Brachionus plicatilis TaxID=10195 RepID=A0A3M7QYD0_BRAPC|nr:polycystic kidney disease 1-like 2 [Brachionus plicatilis]